jgi:predicted ATPase
MTGIRTRPNTIIEAMSEGLLDELCQERTVVLCGRNNSGKSFVLRKLLQRLGEKAFYLGPARYHNFTAFGAYGPSTNRKQQQYKSLLRQLETSEQNIDNSPLDLAQAIAELSDAQREQLFEVLDMLLGSRTEIRDSVAGNSMSQKYISVDGFNLAYQSSGFRLAATLLTCLFDSDYAYMLVDEPELGLSPEVQGVIADFLFDVDQRAKYFPHLKSIVLATHSPVLLDRRNIRSNVRISRDSQAIRLSRISNFQELNELQFQLLGNRFETLHLPSAIVLVEGKTDLAFVNRLLSLRFPGSAISVISCGNDSRVKEVVNLAKQMFGELSKSPYASRLFAVLDSTHSPGLVEELKRLGVFPQNIITWSKNGIEYFYPIAVLEQLYGAFSTLSITADVVSANGVDIRKKDLVDLVVARMTGKEPLVNEIEQKLIRPLQNLIC